MRLSLKTLSRLLTLGMVATGGCAHPTRTFYAPLQPDGWSAQPLLHACRFTPDANLDSATRTPVGDEGYYFYILTKAGAWDYRTTKAFLLTHARQPWGHSWLILESPENRLECGLNGNFGREKPRYDDGVNQMVRDGNPNPISYLWVTMSDGEIELGNGKRDPTFVWRMPITRNHYQRIQDHVMQWKFDQIGVRTNNCVNLVAEASELAGITLIHRIRLTLPPKTKIMGRTLSLWADPQYRVLEYSTPDLLEMDLRQLAQLGIGDDVTTWYLASDLAASRVVSSR